MKTKHRITIYDIAQELRLSPSTVSRALNHSVLIHRETRTLIQSKARDLGYAKSSTSFRNQKSFVLGAIVPDIDTRYTAAVLAGAETMTRQLGYNLIVTQKPDNGKEFENLINTKVDGIIFVDTNYDYLSKVGLPAKTDFPKIIVSAIPKRRQRRRSVTYELTCRMINRGCRRIAYITADGSDGEGTFGYIKAIQENALSEQTILSGLDFFGSGIEIYRELLNTPVGFDGIIFVDKSISAIHVEGIEYERLSTCATAFNDHLRQYTGADFTNAIPFELAKVATLLLIMLINRVR
jgi:LacI family transcriptional regulator